MKKIGLLLLICLVFFLSLTAVASAESYTLTAKISVPDSIDTGTQAIADPFKKTDDPTAQGWQWDYAGISGDIVGYYRWLEEVSSSESYDYTFQGKYYRDFRQNRFVAGKSYAYILHFYDNNGDIPETVYNATTVRINGKTVSSNKMCFNSDGWFIGSDFCVLLGTYKAAACKPYLTALFKDTSEPEAGKSTPMFDFDRVICNPGSGQFKSNFITNEGARVIWAKALTAEEAKTATYAVSVNGASYELQAPGSVFEDGRTYIELFVAEIGKLPDADVTKAALKKVAVKINGKTYSEGLGRIDYPNGKPWYGFVILRTVTIGEAPETPEIPVTGDETPVALTAGLMLLSGAALIVLRKRAR